MKRTRIAPVSKKRLTTWADRKIVREQVFQRDGGCLLAHTDDAGECYGPLTAHHKRKSSQGGSYTLANLVTLCSHHNDELEADADLAALARRMGLVIRRGDA